MTFSDVSSYVESLPGNFKPMVKALRKIIKAAVPSIEERIKWNAPSYKYKEDIVTFGPIRKEKMVLVFHHPGVVKFHSPYLEGHYKDRRLFWFDSLRAIQTAEKDLVKAIRFIVSEINQTTAPNNSSPTGNLKICKQGHEFYKSSNCPVCPKCESFKKGSGFLIKLSAPAKKALEREGIIILKILAKYTENDLLQLHGFGKSSLPVLREALKAAGLDFSNSISRKLKK